MFYFAVSSALFSFCCALFCMCCIKYFAWSIFACVIKYLHGGVKFTVSHCHCIRFCSLENVKYRDLFAHGICECGCIWKYLESVLIPRIGTLRKVELWRIWTAHVANFNILQLHLIVVWFKKTERLSASVQFFFL